MNAYITYDKLNCVEGCIKAGTIFVTSDHLLLLSFNNSWALGTIIFFIIANI